MIGQNNLLQQLNKLTLSTMSQSIMLVGEYGCGKHTVVKNLANKLGVELIDISDNLNHDCIEQIVSCNIPTFYVIGGEEITERQEGVILKFLEEPPSNAFIFILVENENSVLPTIRNRCHLYKFERYSEDELCKFSENEHTEDFYEIANTPGKVIVYSKYNIDEVLDYCDKILTQVKIANFSNILTISNRIDFKNESTDKFNYNLFLDSLLYCSVRQVKLNEDPIYVLYYKETIKLITDLRSVLYIDKIKRFENYLCALKMLKHD